MSTIPKNFLTFVKQLQDIGFEAIDIIKPQQGYNVVLKPGAADVFCIFDSSGKEIDDPRVIQIGREIHETGGLVLMQDVYREAIKPFKSSGPNLKWAWEGIGNWTN